MNLLGLMIMCVLLAMELVALAGGIIGIVLGARGFRGKAPWGAPVLIVSISALALALMLGSMLGLTLLGSMVLGRHGVAPPEARRVAIAVAREDINRGDFLALHMVLSIEVEDIAVSRMHILYSELRSWLGHPLTHKVRAGEPLMKMDFLDLAEPGPPRSIPTERRLP